MDPSAAAKRSVAKALTLLTSRQSFLPRSYVSGISSSFVSPHLQALGRWKHRVVECARYDLFTLQRRPMGGKVRRDEEWITFDVRVEHLEARWMSLVGRLNGSKELANQWWRDLHRRHTESQRHYHNLAHLAELYSFLDSEYGKTIQVKRRDFIELAIFFHDAVYDPRSKTNEEDSAHLFNNFADDAHLPQELASEVTDWILWTKTHEALEGTCEDALLFLDFDMAVLSKPWTSYYRYAAQVRQEYNHVPDEIYCSARPAHFEKQLSSAAHRFYISHGLAHFETRARENLSRECDLLQKGQIPVEA